MDNIWLVVGIAGVVGVAIGAVGFWAFFSPTKDGAIKSKREFAALNKKLEDQQLQINEHFVTTADLVNKLTLTYKEVYDHLSSGAQSLCDEDAATQVLEARENVSKLIAADDARDINPEPTGPAKDYAPKQPDQTGMLSEDFGLNSDDSVK
ncbi:MAG: DUF1043 family protein [Pseudomonadales bacterium]|nr:DUF1043 family protein [Pseudomonadales bacterium]